MRRKSVRWLGFALAVGPMACAPEVPQIAFSVAEPDACLAAATARDPSARGMVAMEVYVGERGLRAVRARPFGHVDAELVGCLAASYRDAAHRPCVTDESEREQGRSCLAAYGTAHTLRSRHGRTGERSTRHPRPAEVMIDRGGSVAVARGACGPKRPDCAICARADPEHGQGWIIGNASFTSLVTELCRDEPGCDGIQPAYTTQPIPCFGRDCCVWPRARPSSPYP